MLHSAVYGVQHVYAAHSVLFGHAENMLSIVIQPGTQKEHIEAPDHSCHLDCVNKFAACPAGDSAQAGGGLSTEGFQRPATGMPLPLDCLCLLSYGMLSTGCICLHSSIHDTM